MAPAATIGADCDRLRAFRPVAMVRATASNRTFTSRLRAVLILARRFERLGVPNLRGEALRDCFRRGRMGAPLLESNEDLGRTS